MSRAFDLLARSLGGSPSKSGPRQRVKADRRPPELPCPACGGRTSTVETRGHRRRRVCDAGHSMHTVEVWEQDRALQARLLRDEQARAVLREKGWLA